MTSLIFLLLALSVLSAALLASVIFIADPKKRLNRYLAAFTLFVSLWAIGDILMLYSKDPSVAHIGALLFYVSPMVTALFLLFFADSSPDGKPVSGSLITFASLVAFTIGWLIILYPPFILKGIYIHQDALNTVVPRIDIFYYVYSAYFNLFFVVTYIKLILRYLHNKGIYKSQLLVMLIGITLTSSAAVTTNLLMPQFGIYDKVWLGPIFTLFFSVMTVFAIIRYRYLNIRLFVARTVAYILLISTLVGLYAAVVFVISTSFFDQASFFALKVVPIIAALFLAATAPHFKKIFDRFTNRLFFQQTYVSSVALSNISSFATRNVDVHSIQTHSLRVIDETIRPTYAGFIVYSKRGIARHSVNSGNYPLEELSLDGFYDEINKSHQKVLVIEDIKQSNRLKHHGELAHIGAIARLSTSNKLIGFLVLGEKKSGRSYTRQDIEFLTLVANDLALALQNALAFEEIRKFNETLQYKINNATRALRRTNEKLVALDDAKDDFISMASHQLRTPLTSVKGYISLMLEGDLGKINARQRQALKEAFDSSQRMVYLISDFLNVSRIRTGKFMLEIVPTNLARIVSDEIEQLRDMAGLRDQNIIFHSKQEVGSVMLDETKTRQVMMNMIDNAIFYTPKEGTINILLEKTSKEIIFKVTDTGIGVPLKDQHRLFTKFFRAGNAKKARPDGTGLGLFMAQKIISAQGGKIIFHSKENQGSTFGFRFPLSKVALKT